MGSPLFSNLGKLKKDMKKKGCLVDSFLFEHNKQQYVVLVRPYGKEEDKPKEAVMELEFRRVGNLRDRLAVPATQWQFMMEARSLRDYFGIAYTDNLGDVIRGFYAYFAEFIPFQVLSEKSEVERAVMLNR